RKQVVIRDQNERPAAHANVRIAARDYRADATGSVMLDEPAAVGAEVWIEGAFAGNVSGSDASHPESTTGRRA
ncbi:MAG TPA: hypothetical protein VFU02_01065, partial [Polyangiaceae bacterium]|nr:hypothetical protein [Polyangiaceae bacterium]